MAIGIGPQPISMAPASSRVFGRTGSRAKISVAVLLSGREKFSAYYGGALARWTFEVYCRLTEQVDAAIFGFPTPRQHVYPLTHHTSPAWRLCDAVAEIPYARRYEDLVWLRALIQKIMQFDIVHIHNRPQWVRILRGLGYQGAIVLHLQNDHLGHWTTPMLNALAPHLDQVVVCSTYLQNTFASRSEEIAAKTRVIYNGVDTDLFQPQEMIRNPKFIFFVGRLDPEKGVLELLQAYARVCKEHSDATLVIGGATGFGSHEQTKYVIEIEALARSIQKSGRGKILMPGYISHDRDLPRYFQQAAIFVTPSLFQEPFGLVNAEAMACATPVLGSNRGGIPEVLGESGILVDPQDTVTFSETLSSLLSDSARRERLGGLAFNRARELFDWRVIAGQWFQTLVSVCRAKAATSRSRYFENQNVALHANEI